jgi:hypothetical protein
MDEGWIGGCAAEAGFRRFGSGGGDPADRGAIGDEGNDLLPLPGPRQSPKPYVAHGDASRSAAWNYDAGWMMAVRRFDISKPLHRNKRDHHLLGPVRDGDQSAPAGTRRSTRRL